MKTKLYPIIKTILFPAIILFTISSCGKSNNGRSVERESSLTKTAGANLLCTAFIDSSFKKNGESFIVIDTMEFLKGEEAVKAFNEDRRHGITKEKNLPGGFYIRNTKKDSIAFVLPDTASIIMQTLHYDNSGNFKYNESITAKQFMALINSDKFQRYKLVPFNIKIADGKIDSVWEVYLP